MCQREAKGKICTNSRHCMWYAHSGPRPHCSGWPPLMYIFIYIYIRSLSAGLWPTYGLQGQTMKGILLDCLVRLRGTSLDKDLPPTVDLVMEKLESPPGGNPIQRKRKGGGALTRLLSGQKQRHDLLGCLVFAPPMRGT